VLRKTSSARQEIRSQGAGVMRCLIHYSSCSSADRSSVRALERITSTASSRERPPISVSHTNLVSYRLHLLAARTMASTDRSTSSAVVDQLQTEIRIAAFPCQVVPPSQQVPSSCTAFTVARVRES
jgi:hypothetical protein